MQRWRRDKQSEEENKKKSRGVCMEITRYDFSENGHQAETNAVAAKTAEGGRKTSEWGQGGIASEFAFFGSGQHLWQPVGREPMREREREREQASSHGVEEKIAFPQQHKKMEMNKTTRSDEGTDSAAAAASAPCSPSAALSHNPNLFYADWSLFAMCSKASKQVKLKRHPTQGWGRYTREKWGGRYMREK